MPWDVAPAYIQEDDLDRRRCVVSDTRRRGSGGGQPPRRRFLPEAFGRSFTGVRTRFSRRRSRARMVSRQDELYRADTPADVTSVRAKSSRHGKSTADKWNQ